MPAKRIDDCQPNIAPGYYLFEVKARIDNRRLYIVVAKGHREAKAVAKAFIGLEIKDVKSSRFEIWDKLVICHERVWFCYE